MNLKRPKFLVLVAGIICGEIATVVIGHKDRLARFGFELFQHLCDLQGITLAV